MKDRPDIKPGDTIFWCDEKYIVLKNHGSRGVVMDEGSDISSNFYWDYDGERALTEEEYFLNKGW